MTKQTHWCRAVAAGVWLMGAWGAAQAALPIQRWVHANGAQVYWVRSDALPMVDVQVDVDGGSRRDPAAQAGLAAATAALLNVRSMAGPRLAAASSSASADPVPRCTRPLGWVPVAPNAAPVMLGRRFCFQESFMMPMAVRMVGSRSSCA